MIRINIGLSLFWNRSILVLSLGVLAGIVLSLHYWIYERISLSSVEIRAALIAPITLKVPGSRGPQKVLRIDYPVNSKWHATEFANELAYHLIGISAITDVEVTYYLGQTERNRRIMQSREEEMFDLMRIKKETLYRLKPPDIEYRAIAHYASYGCYFVSIDEQPALTSEHLSDKKIGLVANANSQSGHICPKAAIRGKLKKSEYPRFVYYASHRDLRAVLKHGEVDIIGTYWGEDDRDQQPSWHSLKIGNITDGDYWYLREKEEFDHAFCVALIEALGRIAKKQETRYWKEVTLMECGV